MKMKWIAMVLSGWIAAFSCWKFIGVSNPIAIGIIGFSVPFVTCSIFEAFFE